MADIHPNLRQLSHSSVTLLHKCPRKYYLSKLLPRPTFSGDDDIHLDFGKLLGVGVQEYLITDSIEKAWWKLFQEWKEILDDERGEKQKKTFWWAMYAVEKFVSLRKTVFGNFELAYIDGKPACELGFSIDCGNGFFYRGFLDALMIDKMRNELAVIENKSTASYAVDEAVFKNSGQGLGYSVVTDRVAQMLEMEIGSSYKVYYPVYKSKLAEWELFQFQKSHTSRAMWIKNLLCDREEIERRAADNWWPMHGETCFDFFRQCQFFGTCELSDQFLVGDLSKVEVREEADDKYQFKFSLKELIESQLSKHEGS